MSIDDLDQVEYMIKALNKIEEEKKVYRGDRFIH